MIIFKQFLLFIIETKIRIFIRLLPQDRFARKYALTIHLQLFLIPNSEIDFIMHSNVPNIRVLGIKCTLCKGFGYQKNLI